VSTRTTTRTASSRVDVEPSDPPATLAARALAYHRWGNPQKVTEVADQMMISFFEQTFPDDLVQEVRDTPEW